MLLLLILFRLQLTGKYSEVSDVTKKMSGIPPVVPKTLRAKVESIQEQLKILLHNYKVFHFNLGKIDSLMT